MGRHTENHRFLKRILVMDDQRNVIQRHEMDSNGRLIADPEAIPRDRAKPRRRASVRLARQASTEFPNAKVPIKLKSETDVWGPVLSSTVLFSTLPSLEAGLDESFFDPLAE